MAMMMMRMRFPSSSSSWFGQSAATTRKTTQALVVDFGSVNPWKSNFQSRNSSICSTLLSQRADSAPNRLKDSSTTRGRSRNGSAVVINQWNFRRTGNFRTMLTILPRLSSWSSSHHPSTNCGVRVGHDITFLNPNQHRLLPQSQPHYNNNHQVRFGSTKRKKKRMARKLKRKQMALAGIPVPKPNGYIDPKTPVINAVPREEQNRRIQERKEKERLEIPPEVKKETGYPPLVLPFQTSAQETEESLTMSPKVAKVLALSNSNQRNVVKVQKAAGMKLFQMRPGDTGSSAVQIVAMTARIQQLDTHIIMHPKEKSAKRRVAMLRGKRRRMIDYLEREDFPTYAKVVTALGLR